MALPPIVGLEIGTSKTVALIAEVQNGGDVVITGMGSCESAGVRKGEIINLEMASTCAKVALGQAEDSAGVEIGEVFLAGNGGHIQSVVSRSSLPIPETDGDGVVTQEHLDDIFEVARAVSLPPDRDVLYAMRQYYTVDDLPGVIAPEGMPASRLSLDVLVLHGIRNRLKLARRFLRNTVSRNRAMWYRIKKRRCYDKNYFPIDYLSIIVVAADVHHPSCSASPI